MEVWLCLLGFLSYLGGFVWYGVGKTTWGPIILLLLGSACFVYAGFFDYIHYVRFVKLLAGEKCTFDELCRRIGPDGVLSSSQHGLAAEAASHVDRPMASAARRW